MRVLYLPGMTGRAEFWEPVAALLPADWDHHLLDWPGLGGNPPSPNVIGLDDLVDITAAELDVPAVLVGQSMGAVVATLATARHPGAVTHLVLVATSGGLDMASFGSRDWRPDYRELWPDAPDWAFQTPPDIKPILESLTVPALVIAGTNDSISPEPVARELATILPSARLVLVDTDDHGFASTQPAPVAQAIRDFVTG